VFTEESRKPGENAWREEKPEKAREKEADTGIHAQHLKGRLGHSGLREDGHDQIQPIASFGDPAATLYDIALQKVLPLQFPVPLNVLPRAP